MTVPTDFSSFAYGFDLTAANYSGGAGGTFTNLKAGGQAWTVQGATPSFTTKSGTGWSMEGMNFSALANEIVAGQQRALWECTVLAICQPGAATTMYPFGTTYTAGNGSALHINAWRLQAYNALGTSAFTSAYATTTVPHVFTASFCPANGTTYAQIDSGTVATATAAAGSFENARWYYPDAGIGQHRTTYFTGWISRVLVFSRALHYRDNTNLQSLINTEKAKVGL